MRQVALPIKRTEGIVLQIVPYKDYHQIATLYTPDYGVLKLIAHYSRTQKSKFAGCFMPLNKLEILFHASQKEIEKTHSASILEPHLALRQSLPVLQTACDMATALLKSQLPGKASPLLYQLFAYFLSKLNETKDPQVFLASFLLKLLRHDGLLAIDEHCSACQIPLNQSVIAGGQVFCLSHAPAFGISFDQEEQQLIYALSLNTSYNLLKELICSDRMKHNIQQVFLERIRN